MLDFERLRALVAVADRGSITAAAAQIRRSQPAVSRQIAALERQVGMPLLIREPTGVRLTAAGELLVAHGRSVVQRLDRAEAQLAMLAGPERRGPRLGSFSSANAELVPQAVAAYLRARPRAARPVVPATDPERHLEELRTGGLDLALITEWDLAHQELDGIELIPLTEDELLLALPRDDPRAAAGPVRLADLAGERWIDGAHPDCLGPLQGLVGAAQAAPTVSVMCEDWTGKQGLVAAGAGTMLVPSLARGHIRGDVVLVPLAEPVPRRRILLACPEGARSAPSVDFLVTALREAAEHCPPGNGRADGLPAARP